MAKPNLYQPSSAGESKLMVRCIENTYKNLPDDEKGAISKISRSLCNSIAARQKVRTGVAPKFTITETAAREILVRLYLYNQKIKKESGALRCYWDLEDDDEVQLR